MSIIIVTSFTYFFVFIISPACAQSGAPIAIRIACGSSGNSQSPAGYVWLKDFGFTGGRSANMSLNMKNVLAPQLNTLRYFEISDGPENCYNVTVPNGHYMLRFFFAFGDVDNSNLEPQFDVSVEGTLVYSMHTPGWSTDKSLSYAEALVYIGDGDVTACFHSSGHGNPSIASIEILQIQDAAYQLDPHWSRHIVMRTVKRVSCSSSSSNATGFGTDFNANVWGGNRYWTSDEDLLEKGSTSSLTTSESINGSSVTPNFYPEVIYQTATTAGIGVSISYKLQVEPNQNYSLWLHFAEVASSIAEKEQRVFDVLVNDKLVFADVDIIRLAGAKFTALVLNKTLLVEGRTLNLTFKPVQGAVFVNAFEIYQVIRTEYTTHLHEVWALQALKQTLQIPSRIGWNGDPCVPQEHPWNGINCGFQISKGGWYIEGIGLDNQDLKGYISNDVSFFSELQSLNFSHNNLYGSIPAEIGNLTNLLILDLSYNRLNGSIPVSFEKLSELKKLYLNGNQLEGEIPGMLLEMPLQGASLNFSDNYNLCGVPGKSCGFRLSTGGKIAIAFACLVFVLLASCCGICMWKRATNIGRSHKLSRAAPYAKSRTNVSKDMQMAKMQGPDSLGSPYSQQPGNIPVLF